MRDIPRRDTRCLFIGRSKDHRLTLKEMYVLNRYALARYALTKYALTRYALAKYALVRYVVKDVNHYILDSLLLRLY